MWQSPSIRLNLYCRAVCHLARYLIVMPTTGGEVSYFLLTPRKLFPPLEIFILSSAMVTLTTCYHKTLNQSVSLTRLSQKYLYGLFYVIDIQSSGFLHVSVDGNERADEVAKAAALRHALACPLCCRDLHLLYD